MSLRKVAQLASVSTSTVSRVMNSRPNVALGTVESVRRAMRQASVGQLARRNGNGTRHNSSISTTIAFLVLGTCGEERAPAFDQLLHGVSAAALEKNLNLILSFVSDPGQLPPQLAQRRVDGLLLHGEQPTTAVRPRLESLPTVWLMANRQRPQWGDQVMPDNRGIGELAARYLLGRGHRRLAYLSTEYGSWSMGIRWLAFEKYATDAGATVNTIQVPEVRFGDLWKGDGLFRAAEVLVQRLIDSSPMPTGLFVTEDRLLPAIDRALSQRRMPLGPGGSFEILSCNNERPHLVGLAHVPPTIDIRAESIGRRGVEQLLWRLRNRVAPERIRSMVEPVLIAPSHVEQSADAMSVAVG